MTDPISNLGSRVDLQIRQGADFATSVSFTNADGTPLDLTGAAFAAQIRRLPTDPAAVASFAVGVPTPATGVVELVLPANVSINLTCGNSIMDDASLYWWAMKFTDATGQISTPLYGQARVSPKVVT